MNAPGFDRAEAEKCFIHGEPNAIEALVVAHRENVHSAMLAWLLGSSDICMPAKVELLKALAGKPPAFTPSAIATTTEWHNLDILVELKGVGGLTSLLAIEHKIKARESDSQLSDYDRELAKSSKPLLQKVFLTFIGDRPRGGRDWRAASYIDLLHGLTAASAQTDSQYMTDYMTLVRRLVASHRLTAECIPYAQYVFGDNTNGIVPGFAAYVDSCRLRVTLQRAWLSEIVALSRADDVGWTTNTDEANGAALVDFARIASRDGKNVRYGLQLQYWQLKAFAHPYPYPKNADGPARKSVETMLREISGALGLGSAQPSVARGRGFRSYRVNRERSLDERYNVVRWAGEVATNLSLLGAIDSAAGQ